VVLQFRSVAVGYQPAMADGGCGDGDARPGDKRAEIYTYEFPNLVYAMNWTVRGASGA
jgi:hypothetical protein